MIDYYSLYTKTVNDYIPQDPAKVNTYILSEIKKISAQAKQAIQEKNYEKRFKLMSKVHIALTGMRESIVETKENTELATAHRNFYDTMLRLVRLIDFENNPKACDALAYCLEEMIQTWCNIATSYKKTASL